MSSTPAALIVFNSRGDRDPTRAIIGFGRRSALTLLKLNLLCRSAIAAPRLENVRVMSLRLATWFSGTAPRTISSTRVQRSGRKQMNSGRYLRKAGNDVETDS